MPRHAEKRVVPFSPDQMFDLVADVDRYPDFLPWCVGCRVRKREPALVVADLVIGYKMIRERFTSRVALDREGRRIDVAYADGPFKYLENHWIFREHDGGCEIDFFVEFEFKSRLLQGIITVVFGEAIRRMVAAFESRARDLYGNGGSGVTSRA